ncbi:MAG: hypothetical protein RL308_897 [Bacteroidota bacterium]|jgi:hypothetical protein
MRVIILIMPIETIHLDEGKYLNYLRSFTNQNWVLCLGAGVCRGILPDWYNLTLKLVNSVFKKNWTSDEFKKISDEVGFSLDSWIQGCFNELINHGKTLEDFNKLLEDNLYEELLTKADSSNLRDALITLFEAPFQISKKNIFKLYDFFEDNYSTTTLVQIVKALIDDSENNKLPNSIITFNADSLLHSLLILYSIKFNFDKTGEYVRPKIKFKKITRPFQDYADNIPIFHLHGSLSPYDTKAIKNKDTRDSLIFLESSYTEIASQMHNWAQTNFLFNSQNSKLIFVGLSMSDPNIRRWLSWTNQTYINELKQMTGGKAIALPHLWIRTKASSTDIQDFLDVSLRHMGVKIGIIENWNVLGETLKKIM